MSPGDSTVLFRGPATRSVLAQDRRAVKEFAVSLAASVVRGRPFTCLITGDSELRELNKKFLDHDYATDVLSFPSLPGSLELGEVAISAERAAEQAAIFAHSVGEELRILMLHGVLHLSGLDHEIDSGEMVAAEEHWRNFFGLPSGVIARSGAEARATEEAAR